MRQFDHIRIVCVVALVLMGVLTTGPASAQTSSGNEGTLSETLKGMSLEEQIEHLMALKEKGRDDASIEFYLGNAMYGMNKPDSAVVHFQKAVAADSTFFKAWVNLGIAWDARGNFPEAKWALEKALELNPDDVLAHCHYGQLLYSQHQYTIAMEHYRTALSIDPNSAQAHYNLGLAFADAQMFPEALKEWEQVVALSPESQLGKTAQENVKLIKQYIDH